MESVVSSQPGGGVLDYASYLVNPRQNLKIEPKLGPNQGIDMSQKSSPRRSAKPSNLLTPIVKQQNSTLNQFLINLQTHQQKGSNSECVSYGVKKLQSRRKFLKPNQDLQLNHDNLKTTTTKPPQDVGNQKVKVLVKEPINLRVSM